MNSTNTMKETHDRARERLKDICRVCPVCNGRSCVSGVPGMGGKGRRTGFKRNIEAFEQILLNLRTIHNACNIDTMYDLFGTTLAMPVLGAPMCETNYNFLGRVDDLQFISDQVKGASAASSLAFTGDSPEPPLYEMGLKAMKESSGKVIPIIKPREPDKIIERIRIAEGYEVPAVGIDIDAAGFEKLTKAGQPVGPLSVSKLQYIIQSTSLPVILKGIMTTDEALKAVDCGAAGLIVSNHGGRALDSTPGTIEVLPEVAVAVKGSIKIFIDSGIRSGEDVLKALALGAEAVLVGRPVAIAAIGGGTEGVRMLYEQLQSELRNAMLLTGCENLKAIGPRVIRSP